MTPALSRLIAKMERWKPTSATRRGRRGRNSSSWTQGGGGGGGGGPPPPPALLSLTVTGSALLGDNSLRGGFESVDSLFGIGDDDDDDCYGHVYVSGGHVQLLHRFVILLEQHRGVQEIEVMEMGTEDDDEGEGEFGIFGNEEQDRSSPGGRASSAPAVPEAAAAAPAAAATAPNAVESLVEQLFGTVLPHHPTLRQFTFTDLLNSASTRYLVLFFDGLVGTTPTPSSLPSPGPFAEIRIPTRIIDLNTVQPLNTASIRDMLRRNAQVEVLNVQSCGIGATGFRTILEGLVGNTHLMELCCIDHTIKIDADTFSGSPTNAMVMGSNSHLRVLTLAREQWTSAGWDNFCFQLRTNTRLETLNVSGGYGFDMWTRLDELLNVYNWTIRRVNTSYGMFSDTITEDRNVVIRHRYSAWENAMRRHRLEGAGGGIDRSKPSLLRNQALWPKLLGSLSSKPTLLYRVLRGDPPNFRPVQDDSDDNRTSKARALSSAARPRSQSPPGPTPPSEGTTGRDRKRPRECG